MTSGIGVNPLQTTRREEEEEQDSTKTYVRCEEALSWRGWNPIKLACRLAEWPAQPTVLVTGPTVLQDWPFSFLAVAVTITSTHFAYSRRGDQSE